MHKITSIAFALCCVVTSTVVASEKGYTIKSWPDDLDKVPCEVWQKKSDGTWTQVKTVTDDKGQNYNDHTFSNSDHATRIEKKCGDQR